MAELITMKYDELLELLAAFESSMNAGTYFNNPELAEKVYPSKTRFIK